MAHSASLASPAMSVQAVLTIATELPLLQSVADGAGGGQDQTAAERGGGESQ